MDLRILVPLLLIVPGVVAQGVELTIAARESGCPGDRDYCYEVVAGDLGDLEPGATVHVTFRNMGEVPHELAMARMEEADPGGDTAESSAFFEIEPIAAGAEEEANFTVPRDTVGLYFWCDIAGHEALGMWMLQEFAEADDAEDETEDEDSTENDSENEDDGAGMEDDGDVGADDDDGAGTDEEEDGGEENGSSLAVWTALVAIVGAVAVLRRR